MADLKLSLLLKAVDKGAKALLKSTKSGVAGLTAENKKAAGVEKLVARSANDTTKALTKETGAMARLGVTAEVAGRKGKASMLGLAAGVAKGSAMLVGAIALMAALAAGAAAIIIPVKLFKFGEKAAKDFSALSDEAQSLGVSIERLQHLREAFRMNDKDVGGAKDLYKSLSEAQGAALKKGSQQAAMFKSIGVSIRGQNGHLKPLPQLLAEAADGYAKIQHTAKKAKIAAGLFGGQIDDLDPILKGGSRALREWGDQADKNNAISQKDADNAKAAHKSYLQLTGSVGGLSNVLAANLFPILKQTTDQTRKWFDNTANRKSIVDAITDSTKALGKALPVILPLIPQFLDATTKLFTQTDWEKAAEDIGQVASAIVALAKAIGFVSKYGGGAMDGALAIAGNNQPLVERLMRDQQKRRQAREGNSAGPGRGPAAAGGGAPVRQSASPSARQPKGQIDVRVVYDGPPKVTTRSDDLGLRVMRGPR